MAITQAQQQPLLPSLIPETPDMSKESKNRSVRIRAAIIIAVAAAIIFFLIGYGVCFWTIVTSTHEVHCNGENEQTNQTLTFEAKMAYIRNLSLEASLPQFNSTIEICKTDECFDTAQEILSKIDGSYDPCEEFFPFVCARYKVNKLENPLPPKDDITVWYRNGLIWEIVNQVVNETDLKPVNQARLFYKQCMKLDWNEGKGLEFLTDLIKSYGGWPLTMGKWNRTGNYMEILEMTAKFSAEVMENIIVGVGIGIDVNNSSKHAIYMGYPEFGVPERALRDPVQHSNILTAYEQFASTILDKANYTSDSVNQTELRESIREMLNFEIKLAQLITFSYDGLYDQYKLPEFENFTGIEWNVYLNKYLSSSNITVDGDEEIYVKYPGYLKGLKTLLESEKVETIANYFIFRIMTSLTEFTNSKLRLMRSKFRKAVEEGYQKQAWEMCVDMTEKVFGFSLGAKYLESNVEWINSTKKEVERFVEEIKTSFIELVGEANWIGDETKENIIEKIEGIRGFIGYPEWLLNESEVEDNYDGLELGESFLESQLKFRFWKNKRNIKKLRKPTDKNEWSMSVWENNARFSHQLNAFAIPFMRNVLPYYGATRPLHQNYGKLGWTLGHELMHAFDNIGMLHDKDGNMRNWWDEESKMKYEKKLDSISKQFSNHSFHYDATGRGIINLDGNRTLSENMADIGGLQIAFRAYQKYIKKNGEEKRLPGLESYTPEQLFYIGHANDYCWWYTYTNTYRIYSLLTETHSPWETRFMTPSKNSEEFRKTFNCKVDWTNETSEVENYQLW